VSEKCEYYNDKIVECGRAQRTIFKGVDSVLHRRSVFPLTHTTNQDIAQTFGALFRDKIVNIRNGLE